MNQRNQIKIIAASLCAAVSMQVLAGLGGLQVQSGLGEPFSGSIVVTGEEARLLLNNNGAAVITGAPLRATVVRQGDNAVLRLRSSQVIHEPLLSFGLVVGGQGRQYSAIMDPPNYRVRAATPPAAGSDGRRDAAKAAVSAALQEARQETAGAQANAAAPVFSGQHYTVQPQEHLIDVARKVQPQGLTLGQTMHALVKANPRAFRNGNPDLMYKNVTLRIPSAEQMRALARQPLRRPAATAGAAAPVTAPEASVAEVPSTTAPAVTASAPADTPPDAQATAAEASAPVAASEPVAASAAMASAAEAASAVVAAPVAPPPPAPVVAPEPEAGFLDGLWPYIIGGGGLLLLLALMLLVRRRQQARADEAEDAADDVVMADEPVRADPSYAVAAAAATTTADEDDDIVFADIEQQIKTAEPPTPQVRMADKPAAPAAKAAAAETNEWAWLDDAAAAPAQPAAAGSSQSTAALSNDDGWLDEQTFKAKEFSPTVAASIAPIAAAAQAAPADDDWLQFDAAEVAAPAATAVVADKAAETAAAEEVVDDWSWFEESAPAELTEPEPVAPAVSVAAAPAPAPAVAATDVEVSEVFEVSLDEAFASDDIEWQVDPDSQIDLAAQTAPQSQAATPTPVDKALADAVADIDLDVDLLTWDDEVSASPTVEAPPAAAATDAIVGMEDLGWDDGMDVALDHDAQKAAHGHKSSEPGDDARQRHAFAAADQDLAVADIDWGALGLTNDGTQAAAPQAAVEADVFAVTQEPVAAASKPASNVNLSVPLEAKLELAQMYLEIDDAQTARRTLQELITEADGEILAKAKSLLAQLGD